MSKEEQLHQHIGELETLLQRWQSLAAKTPLFFGYAPASPKWTQEKTELDQATEKAILWEDEA